ncbi:TPA: hypothetical protein SLP42_000193 [Klebsiella aerogenes]|nr:hypothetical protein [Klebsiella aerogenes]
MTDITELATVLRLAAESEIACRAEGDTSDLWQDEASPENILALVEALEKEVAMREQNLAIKLHMSERIAELESRTVTVKLPAKIERNDIDGWLMYKGGRIGGGAAEWYNKALGDVGAELTAAGIKWEAE